jgi:two-component system sensor histidine kinase VanS
MYETTVARHTHGLHQGLIQSGIALAIMTVGSVALGWLVAGRVLRPLRTITTTTRQISERNLNERLALSGPPDELKDLADTVDDLLARLEAHVAELIERLHTVNTRAVHLTEALLQLSRADQRSFDRERVDLSLIAEEAMETLLPLAEKFGVRIEAFGEAIPTIGSSALLVQMTTNLVHNAIVHNLPEHGAVWVTTSAHPNCVELTVENTGEQLSTQLVATLAEPFQRGTSRIRTDHAGVGLGLAIVKSIAQAHEGTLALTPRAAGGLRVTVQLPAAPAPPANDQRGCCAAPGRTGGQSRSEQQSSA